MRKYDKQNAELNHPQEGIKLANIPDSNTVVDPGTMVIIPVDTGATNKAVKLVFFLISALGTEGQL
jgi:hypothetical protein